MKKQVFNCTCERCGAKQDITIGTKIKEQYPRSFLLIGNDVCDKCGGALWFTGKLLPTKKFVGVIDEEK